VTLIC